MRLAQHNLCTGCGACYASCPAGAIQMVSDNEGFLYPQIKSDKCLNCGLCERACPIINQKTTYAPASVVAAYNNDGKIRMQSSSGGVFYALAMHVINKKGVVFGATIDCADMLVKHIAIERENELDKLQGSKYVQSNVYDILTKVRDVLIGGRYVMFVGTPCQVMGLKSYLKKDYPNLICVDLICSSVPSPSAWKRYLEKRSSSSLVYARFRDKTTGWASYSMRLQFSDKVEYLRENNRDSFLCGFVKNLFSRPSCGSCPARKFHGNSDITIGDYWGVTKHFPFLKDNKGISLVILNTHKGTRVFNDLSDDLVIYPSSIERAVEVNPALVKDWPAHKNRQEFFDKLEHTDFDKLVWSMLGDRPKSKLVIKFLNLCYRLKKICKLV